MTKPWTERRDAAAVLYGTKTWNLKAFKAGADWAYEQGLADAKAESPSEGELIARYWYRRLGMDGQKWAKEFVKMWSGHVVGTNDTVDEGLMHTWFANAILAGYDRCGVTLKTVDELHAQISPTTKETK